MCSEAVIAVVSDFDPAADTLSPAVVAGVAVEDAVGVFGVADTAVAAVDIAGVSGSAADVADIACLGSCESVPKTVVVQADDNVLSDDSCPCAAAYSSLEAAGQSAEVFVARR